MSKTLDQVYQMREFQLVIANALHGVLTAMGNETAARSLRACIDAEQATIDREVDEDAADRRAARASG